MCELVAAMDRLSQFFANTTRYQALVMLADTTLLLPPGLVLVLP